MKLQSKFMQVVRHPSSVRQAGIVAATPGGFKTKFVVVIPAIIMGIERNDLHREAVDEFAALSQTAVMLAPN